MSNRLEKKERSLFIDGHPSETDFECMLTRLVAELLVPFIVLLLSAITFYDVLLSPKKASD